MNIDKARECIRAAAAALGESECAQSVEATFISPGEALLLLPGDFTDRPAKRRRFEQLRSALAADDRRLVRASEWVRLIAWRRICEAEHWALR
jgi:hypothetical protein